ncbi:AtpZ/AtpI family protein [Propionibacterium australiense]|uniref:Uncharacterized protein n=1 Tax=Propionibacterium australiense TaxID=119981 RepID=A0A383S3X2_9ACTN|nr:hypothetical protein [Propionibacterium australiense]RLP11649.1 hypothetical protein D9T14_03360 [Propionibacterium australiense]RLP12162.1 hypothetical protein D7U36_02545 [Propionibacterium australiense]SYZ32381.1 Hypothetical protein PROPAUS_0258 [Propionibacterium australiense]VEH90327.1 Putative F0F1-ATPase subunit (ATPase_gene1) [Propionibacterium australiense]
MSDHQLETPTNGAESSPAGNGVAAVPYLLAGIGFYGALGWLADHFLHTRLCLPVGLVLGAAAAVYLIVKRFGGDA